MNYPETILHPVHRKTIFHEIGPLYQKGWGPLLWGISAIPSLGEGQEVVSERLHGGGDICGTLCIWTAGCDRGAGYSRSEKNRKFLRYRVNHFNVHKRND